MPSREYRDPSGTLWEIFEVHRLNHRPNTVRPALSSGWLAFVSFQEKRRLPEYPTRWAAMTDPELQALLEEAFVAPNPRFPVPSVATLNPGSAVPSTAPVTTSLAVTSEALPAPAPSIVTGVLAPGAIDSLVRAHARQARVDGVAVIEGMIGVKRALKEAGEDPSRESLRALRKVFIDEFYFAR